MNLREFKAAITVKCVIVGKIRDKSVVKVFTLIQRNEPSKRDFRRLAIAEGYRPYKMLIWEKKE